MPEIDTVPPGFAVTTDGRARAAMDAVWVTVWVARPLGVMVTVRPTAELVTGTVTVKYPRELTVPVLTAASAPVPPIV